MAFKDVLLVLLCEHSVAIGVATVPAALIHVPISQSHATDAVLLIAFPKTPVLDSIKLPPLLAIPVPFFVIVDLAAIYRAILHA